MDARRRQHIALAALAAILVSVIWWQMGRSGDESPAAAGGARATAPAGAATRAKDVPEVRLTLLADARPEPVDTGRDPFVFGSRKFAVDGSPQRATGPGGAPSGGRSPQGVGSGPEGLVAPAGPPPPPPIPLKFIGLVQKQGDTARIAVLSDSRGVYHGREGDIIEGRYRIVRISDESIEMVYVDGRGRQVIRLSGA